VITHRNRRGQEYYLHEGKTKTGKVSYFFSRKTDGILAAAMPPGFEAYETGDGLIVLRRTIPCLVTSEEVTAVWTALKENAKARSAYIDARGDAITVFMPDIDVEESTEDIVTRNPLPILNRKRLSTILERSQTFTPMMRFVLLDEKKREFTAKRWCFSSGIDDWVYIGNCGPLLKIARQFCRHLGRESFFELM